MCSRFKEFLLVFTEVFFLLSDCKDGDIRLVGVSNPLEGRLEVCYDGVWGTVCHNHWNALDASVACFQLGYSASGKILVTIVNLPKGPSLQ